MRNKSPLTPLATLLAVWIPTLVAAQDCVLLEDINRARNPFDSAGTGARVGSGGTTPTDGVIRIGGSWYFSAVTQATGRELYKTDGTAAGTVLVKDINPGQDSSTPFYLVECAGKLYFQADDGVHGTELWCSDGTAAGTVMVKDVRPGAFGSNPSFMECVGAKLYFAADDGVAGSELWQSDGTATGTSLLKDIRAGSSGSLPRYLQRTPSGNAFLFQAFESASGNELWKSDGTAAGTVLVKDIFAGPSSGGASGFQNLGPTTLFRARDAAHGVELWKTDGTAAGTVLVKDIFVGSSSSTPRTAYRAVMNGELFFAADDGVTGVELWKTNGTTAGTVLVKDIGVVSPGSGPANFLVSGTTLFFSAQDTGVSGRELWKTDGTNAGTVLVQDIFTGAASSSPRDIVGVVAGRVFFSAENGNPANGRGRELYVTDGTAAGTSLVKDLFSGPGDSSPDWLTVLSPTEVMFFADDGAPNGVGRELFKSDGTANGTSLIKDINSGGFTASSSPSALACVDGETLYFEADDGVHGDELWKSVRGVTSLVKDINPGNQNSDPAGFASCWNGSRSITVFAAAVPLGVGRELWITDGTATGTQLLKDINPGLGSSDPLGMFAFGNAIYFTANDGTNGYELWKTDGTSAGTVLVKDINPGAASSAPSEFVRCRNTLYFTANDGSSGIELWKSDGSTAATVRVADLSPGPTGSRPFGLTCYRGRLAFRASSPATGAELFATDGTATGTVLVKDIHPGTPSSDIFDMVECGGTLYFAAFDGANGTELWKSDLTAAGTVLLKDIAPGAANSVPRGLTCAAGKLFFSAAAPTGRELYVSDGTSAGTRLVADLHPGSGGSGPANLISAGDGVFFSANVPGTAGGRGAELYYSDGTAVGTKLWCDVRAGFASSAPSSFTICCGTLYFVASDGVSGSEVWRVSGWPGTVEVLGQGCGPDQPRLDATNPLIGRSMTISGTGAPTRAGVLVLGLPGKPIGLPPILFRDCAVWLNLALFEQIRQPAGASWSFRVGVPRNHFLIGEKFVLQSVYDAPAAAEVSNGLQLTVGGR